MSIAKREVIHRRDYTAPSYTIDDVELSFDLGNTTTTVEATIRLHQVEARRDGANVPPLYLHGEELELLQISIDGKALQTSDYSVNESGLIVHQPPEAFTLRTIVRFDPHTNKSMSGLYVSNGAFTTQCEAEGFRRITYFLDRPDVLARFKTRLTASKVSHPVLLSNGNRVDSGDLADGRHFVEWHDPSPKPSYLFALVGGDLKCVSNSYKTMSGRDVALEIWVETQNIARCDHAMQSLKNAMKWDEDKFGLEYELDIYMIVAVDDFNMGAMENKGLNIFNSKYVLADPETATDEDYEGIEAVIAHEYFHNWTGNRVTCSDWFQLTLKEGLTVFRDQSFSADMTSGPVKRISDVKRLRTFQFIEDAGPTKHPIRPESYIEINNFYTSTIYDKGAEVVRMYDTILGKEGFRKGMDLYFERHDGEAVTCDDFRNAMADANGIDLAQFERWYSYAGTPRLRARSSYHRAKKLFTIELTQHDDTGRRFENHEALMVPISVGLVSENGQDIESETIILDQPVKLLQFEGIEDEPTASVLRNFSAPMILEFEQSREQLAFLSANDNDPFNRWEASQKLAESAILELSAGLATGEAMHLNEDLASAFGAILADNAVDGSLKSLMLSLPGERILAQKLSQVNVDHLNAARSFTQQALAQRFETQLLNVYEQSKCGPYSVSKEQIDSRRLKNLALEYLCSTGSATALNLAEKQYTNADNMTDRAEALQQLVNSEHPSRQDALKMFYDRWQDNPLVLDKWFSIQARSAHPDAAKHVEELTKHSMFGLGTPNRVRALLSAFSVHNQVRFHSPTGLGYRILADTILALDHANPQLGARLASAFSSWKQFTEDRQVLIKAQLERILAHTKLSADVFEIVSRSLGTLTS